jgi:hypothetical protein
LSCPPHYLEIVESPPNPGEFAFLQKRRKMYDESSHLPPSPKRRKMYDEMMKAVIFRPPPAVPDVVIVLPSSTPVREIGSTNSS